MSKKYFVVAYKDSDGIERVAPKTLTVTHGDYVIWCNNLTEDYMAQNFQGPPGVGSLFPDSSYLMPPNDTSKHARVKISQQGNYRFTYDCENALKDKLDPVIIVDNPGMVDDDDDDDDDKRKRTKSKSRKSKAAGKGRKSKKRR